MVLEKFPQPVNFKELFRDIPGEKYPQVREYKGKNICLIDSFPVKNRQKLIFSIEETNSDYPQGFGITIYNGFMKLDGKQCSSHKAVTNTIVYPRDVLNPQSIEIQIYTQKAYIFINNVWETTIYEERKVDGTKPATESEKVVRFPEGKLISCYVGSGQWAMGRGNGAAMYCEEIPGGRRYFCNDGKEDDDFDDIVFTVRRKEEHL